MSVSINQMYTDISPEMSMAWNRDVAKSVGTRAVKNSLLGIITTRKGSKPFDPEFGCDMSDQLFENLSPLTANTLERSITAAVRTYEPRIVRLGVNVIPQYDLNTIIVDVRFSILDNPDTLEALKLQLSNGLA
jgi:phage baseplate assembly protein W